MNGIAAAARDGREDMKATERIRALRVVLGASGIAIAVLLLGAGQTLAQSAPEELQIDWTMPDRYGADEDGNGLVDSYPPDGDLEIEPDGFRVDLEATGSACAGGAELRWTIDGQFVASSDPAVLDGDPETCSFAYRFEEGTFEVAIEARDGDETVAEGIQQVRVRDFLIVSIGDSVASGEGNPDVPFVPRWQNRQCHRSALAGPARAAQAIEAMDERSSVTFVHLACSGATTLEGLLGPYEGQEPDALLPPQVEELERLAGEREIDAVLVSIGANDVRFAKVVEKCLLQSECDFDEPGSAARQFAKDLVKLPGNYDQLAAALTSRNLPASRVYLAEYFDPTRDDAGQVCDETMLADFPLAKKIGFVITASEATWASETMMPQLNLEGARAAARHGWNRVGGIRDPFLTHGYCADNHWVVRYAESMPAQGNKDGTLHPNGPGHERYGLRIAEALADDLFDEEPLRITTSSPLPRATLDEEYSTMLRANRDSDALVWAVVSGSLPDGLELRADGEIFGTPSETGSAAFTIQVTDPADGASDERVFSLTVTTDEALGTTWGEAAADVAPDGSLAAILMEEPEDDWYGPALRLMVAGADGEVDFTAELPSDCDYDPACFFGLGSIKTATRMMPDGGAVVALLLDGDEHGVRAVVARYSPAGEKLWEKTFTSVRERSRIGGLAVAPDGRIALATWEFQPAWDSEGIYCPNVDRGSHFLGSTLVELDAAGEVIREESYRTTATCDEVEAGLGDTRVRITGVTVDSTGNFVSVGYRSWEKHDAYSGPFDPPPPENFRVDLGNTTTVPTGGGLLEGIAASGGGLYVRLFETADACGSRLAGLAGATLVPYADSSLCTEQGFGRLTGQAGIAGSLIWIAGERTLERMRDIGGSAFKRTLSEDRRVIAVSPNADNTEVFTVEQRTPTDGYSPVVRGILNADLTD
jgi:lysophospholipase L1-like esterase